MCTRPQTLVSIGFLVICTLFGCTPSEVVPTKDAYDDLLSNLGQTSDMLKSIRATAVASPEARGSFTGVKIVKDCLAFYDPSHGTTPADVGTFFGGFSTYVYDNNTGSKLGIDDSWAALYLYNVCHSAWLVSTGQTPWNFPTDQILQDMLWNPGLYFYLDWSPTISGIGDAYTPDSAYNTLTGIDAWKIGRKFLKTGATKRQAVVRILRWMKASLASNGYQGTPVRAHALESFFTALAGWDDGSVRAALMNIFQALLIPAVQFDQVSSTGLTLRRIWLPEEDLFIDPLSLAMYPALPAENCLLSSALVANGQIPLSRFFLFLGGPNGRLTQLTIFMGSPSTSRTEEISTGGRWLFSDLTPTEVAQLRQELPQYMGASDFIPSTPPRYEQLLDPSFELPIQ